MRTNLGLALATCVAAALAGASTAAAQSIPLPPVGTVIECECRGTPSAAYTYTARVVASGNGVVQLEENHSRSGAGSRVLRDYMLLGTSFHDQRSRYGVQSKFETVSGSFASLRSMKPATVSAVLKETQTGSKTGDFDWKVNFSVKGQQTVDTKHHGKREVLVTEERSARSGLEVGSRSYFDPKLGWIVYVKVQSGSVNLDCDYRIRRPDGVS